MGKRMARGLLLVLLAVIFTGALSIPFVYESQTLWYKAGYDKSLLRGGQLVGLLAALSIFIQILLGVRGKYLEELFGMTALMRLHRINGLTLALLAILHIVLVQVPEGIANLPIGVRFWPEMVGMLLFSLILTIVISSQFRLQIGLGYQRWRLIHRMLAYLVPFLLTVHVLFVSDSFEHGIPQTGLFAMLIAVAVWILRIKGAYWLKKKA
jgi:predicted ferric reductase